MAKKNWGVCPPDKIEIGDIFDLIGTDDVQCAWVEALRSGKYEQATGYLRRIDPVTGSVAYDSLGLLCRVCVDLQLDDLTDEEWAREAPPTRTVRLVGMSPSTNKDGMAYGGEVDVLEKMNDRGDSFEMIADAIETRKKGSPIKLRRQK